MKLNPEAAEVIDEASVKRATDEYRREMDIISKFLDECTTTAPCRCVKAKDLYNVYVRWCDENGEFKLTNTKFGSEVVKRYQKTRIKNGLVYNGIDFNDDYRPYSINISK